MVAKVEFHAGELFPRVGFIVTSLETDSRAVVRFYSKRGTAEQWIKEGKPAVKMTRLSCHRFRSNEVAAVVERDRVQPGEPLAAAFRLRPAADRMASAPGGMAGASDGGKLGEPRDRGRTDV